MLLRIFVSYLQRYVIVNTYLIVCNDFFFIFATKFKLLMRQSLFYFLVHVKSSGNN